MKWLAAVLGACLLLVGALAWRLAREEPGNARPAPRAVRTARPASHDGVKDGTAAENPSHTPPQAAFQDGASTTAAAAVYLGAKQQRKNTADTAVAHRLVSYAPSSGAPAHSGPVSMTNAQRRLTAAQEALRADPDNAGALRDAVAAARESEDWPTAAHWLGRLADLEPDDARARFEHAAVLMRLKRWLPAVEALQALLEKTPEDARAWHNLAVAQQALRRLDAARRAWDRVLELTPDDPDAHARRGEALLDLREWPAARADFEAALRHEPDSVELTMNLALALWMMEHKADALDRLQALLDRHPRHVPLLNRLAEMAWTLHQSDPATHAARREAALEWARRSLEIDPRQPWTRALRDAIEGNPTEP